MPCKAGVAHNARVAIKVSCKAMMPWEHREAREWGVCRLWGAKSPKKP